MGALKKLAIVTVGLALFLAWATNYKTPEGFQAPTKLKIFFASLKGINIYSSIGEMISGEEYMRSFRRNFKVPTENSAAVTTEERPVAEVPCRIYTPKQAQGPLPGIVYYHGGGWTWGNLDSVHNLSSLLCEDLKVVVVSVDYRLAPEYTYPTPMDDCFKVTKYVLNHAGEFNIDPSRVSIAGDSAGGNLAAVVALRLRDEKVTPKVRSQYLFYPALQPYDFLTTSYKENQYDGLLTSRLMVEFWNIYTHGHKKYVDDMLLNRHIEPTERKRFADRFAGSKASRLLSAVSGTHNNKLWAELQKFYKDPYLTPLAAQDLSQLPSTVIITAEQDVLRDDGELYTYLLQQAGNNVIHKHVIPAFHGLLSLGNIMGDDFAVMYRVLLAAIKELEA